MRIERLKEKAAGEKMEFGRFNMVIKYYCEENVKKALLESVIYVNLSL